MRMRKSIVVVGVFALIAGCGGGEESDRPRTTAIAVQPPEAVRPAADSIVEPDPLEVPDLLEPETPVGDESNLQAPAASDQSDAGSADVTGGDTSPSAPTPPVDGRPAPGQPSGGATPDAQSNDPMAILARAEEAYAALRSLQADFIQRVQLPLLDTIMTGHGTLYHRTPDRFRMDFADPEGDIVVADGTYGWTYYPSADPVQVVQVALGGSGQQVDLLAEFLRDATDRFSASHIGSETISGRTLDILQLDPREASPYRRVRLWIDRQDSFVRRLEIVEESESIRTIDLSNIVRNPTLGDALFRFEPPPGTQIFRR